MRRSKILSIQIEDINWAKQEIFIPKVKYVSKHSP